jgi:hypothetical protein
MSISKFFANLVGGSAAKPIEAVGNVLDKLFTSDEEKLDKKIILERLRQHPAELQVELNKIEAQHRTIFVAGWRPFIGWVCGIGLGFVIIVNPLLGWLTTRAVPQVPEKLIFDLIIALLGLGTLRTYEKVKGKSK